MCLCRKQAKAVVSHALSQKGNLDISQSNLFKFFSFYYCTFEHKLGSQRRDKFNFNFKSHKTHFKKFLVPY